MMYAPPKLTKKQRKGLAFRERTGKRHSRNELIEMESAAVPVMEDQDIASVQCDTLQNQKKHKEGDETVRVSGHDKQGRVAIKGKGPAEEKDVSVSVEEVKTTKRKRAHDGLQEDLTSERKVLRQKKDKDVTQSNETKGKTAVKQRFILFVGNLKYTTTRETIQAHFAICDPPPTIRLLTPTSTSESQRAKSKGCAFLEFSHRNALQQALKFHQSALEGRMINVELTAGGGGKSETRLAKVRERNKALLVQRTQRIEMEDPNGDRISQKPQRFSATSGMEQVPVAKRSWTVGDDGATHRGGIKHKKKSKSKTWGTGVNAIPVG